MIAASESHFHVNVTINIYTRLCGFEYKFVCVSCYFNCKTLTFCAESKRRQHNLIKQNHIKLHYKQLINKFRCHTRSSFSRMHASVYCNC